MEFQRYGSMRAAAEPKQPRLNRTATPRVMKALVPLDRLEEPGTLHEVRLRRRGHAVRHALSPERGRPLRQVLVVFERESVGARGIGVLVHRADASMPVCVE